MPINSTCYLDYKTSKLMDRDNIIKPVFALSCYILYMYIYVSKAKSPSKPIRTIHNDWNSIDMVVKIAEQIPFTRRKLKMQKKKKFQKIKVKMCRGNEYMKRPCVRKIKYPKRLPRSGPCWNQQRYGQKISSPIPFKD